VATKQPATGTILRIPLKDGSYGYGQTLEFPYVAFYDFRSEAPLDAVDEIIAKPVAFTVAVHKSALQTWNAIGRRTPDRSLQPPTQFMQRIGDPANCTIVDPGGNERPARPEECVGLERVSIWEPSHVEDRLLDMFMQRPNKWVEQLKVKLPG
jgi:hypothetical protein